MKLIQNQYKNQYKKKTKIKCFSSSDLSFDFNKILLYWKNCLLYLRNLIQWKYFDSSFGFGIENYPKNSLYVFA